MSQLATSQITIGAKRRMQFNHFQGKLDKNNKKKSISNNLAALLKQQNLSGGQLAQVLGIPMMTVRRLLSGETEDPRISTLKIIADYFNISIDFLIGDDPRNLLISSKKIKSYLIPKVGWDSLTRIKNIDEFYSSDWHDWQSISLSDNDAVSRNSFALESRPSMYPRFPKGTIFIIDPTLAPTDGDIVLIKIKENNEYTLRELIVDPPNWRLSPLVLGSNIINFSMDEHEITGVSLLTMLYNPKLNG